MIVQKMNSELFAILDHNRRYINFVGDYITIKALTKPSNTAVSTCSTQDQPAPACHDPLPPKTLPVLITVIGYSSMTIPMGVLSSI